MEKFISDDFLLENKYARELYHEFAENLPLIDFHCHLDPAEIAEDKHWDNIAQVWLGGDHYKWRLMRSNGVDEKFCTGDAPDREKFQKFAEAMPYMLRNPMYHWCHLELARFFGIDDVLLSGDTAEEVWRRANEALRNGLSARECMRRGNVEAVCTTDDPTSDLARHAEIAKSGFEAKVLPTFRPDKAFAIESHDYIKYLEQLEAATGIEIKSYYDLLAAIKQRHDFFHERGCRVSDYGVETVCFKNSFYYEVEDTFKKAINSSEHLAADEVVAFKSAILLECASMDYEKGWVRQLHIGAIRNNNSKMYQKLGPDTGFDSIGEANFAKPLARHLDKIAEMGNLGKTIIYNINPKDNEMIGSMLGNFQDSFCAGKLQLGAAWWFLDSYDGMRRQLEALSNLSLLGRFVGMLTDSRSFLSYARHEYFRRILCNLLGSEMERGLLPRDMALVGKLVSDVSYNNAKAYFGI